MEADIPFRELSFEGVPFRTNVRLQPTTDCLVHLSDPPFLVVTLNEIEIASLERVQWGLKQFDMVLIFQDFTRPPLQINSIPSNQLDDVKNWLEYVNLYIQSTSFTKSTNSSVEIPLAEGPVNLNWGPIMKTINESPYDFFQQGGWSFLGGTGGDEDSDGALSSSESEFAADSSEAAESESEVSASEFGDSDASDDSGSASSFGEGDSSGKWAVVIPIHLCSHHMQVTTGTSWIEKLQNVGHRHSLLRYCADMQITADRKKAQNGRGNESGSDSDRPKKKSAAKTNGKKSKR